MPMTCRRWLTVFASFVALGTGTTSCKRESPASHRAESSPAAASGQPATEPGPEPYPRARWRLAPASELESVMFWVSHILIRHEEIGDTQASFQLAGWALDLPPAKRSRRQALELAEMIAKEARERGNFAELARRYSDDASTSENGGSLDGITGPHLWPWPNVLDALATMKPGDVSRVVETQYGFHVFQLKAAPPEGLVSGEHIVIAHDQAPGLDAVARRKPPSRSRAEALALATSLYERARAAPAGFGKLAEEHSDHRDAVNGGDFGTWSTHEPTGLYREVDVLAHLAVGEISAPFDTPYGLQIFKRTADRPRVHYAMLKLQLRFDPALPDRDPGSKVSAFAVARKLAAQLALDPSRFAALRAEHCCPQPMRLVQGRELPALEAVLQQLQPGQIATEPIEDALEYTIPKRVELGVLRPTPPTRFELPSPPAPDLRYILSRAPALGKELGAAARRAATALTLPDETAMRLSRLQTVPADFEQQALDARLRTLDAMDAALTKLLEPATLERYREVVHRHFEELILRQETSVE